MKHHVFIDGQAGTTGLEIHARLSQRSDIELLEIDPHQRKNPAARRELLNAADLVILCLPDAAAREAVALIDNDAVRVLDASTAYRTAADWRYGLAELTPTARSEITRARRVSNPGCYPTGFLLAVRPLVDAGVLRADVQLTINALSGYSGGGRAMVERYEGLAAAGTPAMLAPRPYALTLAHKHLPEMQHFAGLSRAPLFAPMVGHYRQGMLVQIPLTPDRLLQRTSASDVAALLAQRYHDEPCVEVFAAGAVAALDADGFLDPQGCNGTNRVDLMVFGDDEALLLVARLDNLGKGAGGAAIQNMNLMLGLPELGGVEAGLGAEHGTTALVGQG